MLPLSQFLGRIINAQPGEDSEVREMTIKIGHGEYGRGNEKYLSLLLDMNYD